MAQATAGNTFTRAINGAKFPEAYRGQTIEYNGYVTVKEWLTAHQCDQVAVLILLNKGLNIMTSDLVAEMATAGKPLEEIGAAIGTFAVDFTPAERKGNPEALAAARAAKEAMKVKASKMDALEAHAAADPTLAALLAKVLNG